MKRRLRPHPGLRGDIQSRRTPNLDVSSRGLSIPPGLVTWQELYQSDSDTTQTTFSTVLFSSTQGETAGMDLPPPPPSPPATRQQEHLFTASQAAQHPGQLGGSAGRERRDLSSSQHWPISSLQTQFHQLDLIQVWFLQISFRCIILVAKKEMKVCKLKTKTHNDELY